VRTLAAVTATNASISLAVPASALTRPAVMQDGASYAETHGYTVGIAVLDTENGRFYGSGAITRLRLRVGREGVHGNEAADAR
jgi:hypothetical protein